KDLIPILDADEVLIAALRVDPEGLLVVHDAGIGGGNDALHDFSLVQAHFLGLLAVDLDNEFGRVLFFQDSCVHDPVNSFDLCQNFVGQPEQDVLVLAHELDVDRRRSALIQSAANQSARVKGELNSGKLGAFVQSLAENANILLGSAFTFRAELDFYKRIHGAGVGRVGCGPIRGCAKFANGEFQIFLGDVLANEMIDFLYHVLRTFNASSTGAAYGNFKSAGVRFGEKVTPQDRNESRQRDREQGKSDDDRLAAMME